MGDGKVIAIREGGVPVPSKQAVEDVHHALALFQEMVTTLLVRGRDYGGIPGVAGQTLLDSGANLVINAFDAFPGERRVLRMDMGEGRITVVMEVPLVSRKTGLVVATGVGAASTLETKHKYRWVKYPAEWGYEKEDIARLRKRPKGQDIEYRIPNPEPEELINTLIKMSSKRAEVDAACALPGVPAALKTLYASDETQEPAGSAPRRPPPTSTPKAEWSRFWGEVTRLGYTPAEARERLGVDRMEDYVAGGRTLDQALAILRAESPPPGAPSEVPLRAETEPEDPFPAKDPREEVREEIVRLLEGPCPTASQMRTWWESKGWGYALDPEALKKATELDPVVALEHLVAFRDDLVAYQKKATPAIKKEATQ